MKTGERFVALGDGTVLPFRSFIEEKVFERSRVSNDAESWLPPLTELNLRG